MSLKENVDYIKNEIDTEEKFLEGFVKLERVFKKYKFLLISTVAVVLIAFIGNSVKNYLDNETKLKANAAYNTLQTNPNDTVALAILKDTNENLYNIVLFLNSKKETTNIDSLFLKELSEYAVAIEKSDMSKLNSLTMNQDFILKEYVIFNKALLETKNNEFEKAKKTLEAIGEDSTISKIVNSLRHYLITK
ncbi:MAG: hypothetical protein HOF69_05020 [Campylobacteraceae bacterium]|jgi:hypothetical protein|nr:hypothetical protein [Campylobacteraceae bacterium]MBT3882603.1 hypothetical protein [Campylobacteraceae bacterium]MBT4031060.1 hypothetical protein [Campylobacteraceae bacterium]MBT4179143.1 hypothetical protein [Campylobacteraceae bacterium]MBT4571777.1 hypothetical protein [Campylobacteraceae bacterium]